MITRMTELRWSHLDGDNVGAWSALINTLATADGTGEFYEPEDLAEELGETGLEPSTDTWAVWADEQLVAYGQLRVGFTTQADGTVRCQLDGGVHPEWRGRGVGSRLMDAMEQRACVLSAQRMPGVPAEFRVEAGLAGSSASRMLTARGYRIARWFILMELPLRSVQAGVPAAADSGAHTLTTPPTQFPLGSMPEGATGFAVPGAETLTTPLGLQLPLDAEAAARPHPVVPDGFTLASPKAADEEDVRLAHNSAFADHWGSAPMTAERWHDFYAGRPMRLGYSTIARNPDGDLVSYVLVGQYMDDEAYVDLVGTVAGARGRGVAGAALARTIELVRDVEGLRVLGLEVDSDSPTGATRLYERLGFSAKNTRATMTRPA